ncbi:MAG: hypothetical protein FWC81_03475, partial [Coriobacteriia bacterium]|nr:hypothetical protein [Coriobacteriia bacterium]
MTTSPLKRTSALFLASLMLLVSFPLEATADTVRSVNRLRNSRIARPAPATFGFGELEIGQAATIEIPNDLKAQPDQDTNFSLPTLDIPSLIENVPQEDSTEQDTNNFDLNTVFPLVSEQRGSLQEEILQDTSLT